MATRSGPASGDLSLAEIKEFAGFAAGTQRYIRRSLDIGLERDDAIARWSRVNGTSSVSPSTTYWRNIGRIASIR